MMRGRSDGSRLKKTYSGQLGSRSVPSESWTQDLCFHWNIENDQNQAENHHGPWIKQADVRQESYNIVRMEGLFYFILNV